MATSAVTEWLKVGATARAPRSTSASAAQQLRRRRMRTADARALVAAAGTGAIWIHPGKGMGILPPPVYVCCASLLAAGQNAGQRLVRGRQNCFILRWASCAIAAGYFLPFLMHSMSYTVNSLMIMCRLSSAGAFWSRRSSVDFQGTPP